MSPIAYITFLARNSGRGSLGRGSSGTHPTFGFYLDLESGSKCILYVWLLSRTVSLFHILRTILMDFDKIPLAASSIFHLEEFIDKSLIANLGRTERGFNADSSLTNWFGPSYYRR